MEKKVFNLIIVDESGSMSIIRKQAFAGLNETIKTVKTMEKEHPDVEQRITLLTFDSSHRHFVYDNTPAAEAHELKWDEYCPGGATPLYDAIGLGISKLNSQCTDEDNVLVTIITDGEENCSEEYSLKMVKTLIEKLKKQHWTFTLIGTDNLDVEGMARSFAIDNHLQFSEDAEGTQKMFDRELRSRRNYNSRVACGCAEPKGGYFKEE